MKGILGLIIAGVLSLGFGTAALAASPLASPARPAATLAETMTLHRAEALASIRRDLQRSLKQQSAAARQPIRFAEGEVRVCACRELLR